MNHVLLEVVGVAVFVLGLAVSIALHELGHLVPAKAFGVKVTQYMIGFGPTVLSRRRGETEYGLKAVPLGGYIRMIGMYAPPRGPSASRGRWATMAEDARRLSADEVGPGDEPRTFHRLAVGKRIVVMLGGPVMNLLLATVFLGAYLCAVGVPTAQAGAQVQSVSRCVQPAAQQGTTCSPGDPRAPAAVTGLRAGDRLLTIDGVRVRSTSQVGSIVRPRAGRPTALVVERSGHRLHLTITPIATKVAVTDSSGRVLHDSSGATRTRTAGFLGITTEEPTVVERQPVSAVPGAVARATGRVAAVVLDLPARMVGVAHAAFGHGARDPNGPVGIVGVGRLSGEVATSPLLAGGAERAGALLGILASLNLALFVFNLVPLLPLDGGHIAGALWEAGRRRVARWRHRPDPGPFDLAHLLPVAYGVAAVLVVMEVVLLYADIVRPVTLG